METLLSYAAGYGPPGAEACQFLAMSSVRLSSRTGHALFPPCLRRVCRWWRRWIQSQVAGNYIYFEATKKIQIEVSTGNSLTASMANTNVFPSMALQMTAIGENPAHWIPC